MMKHVFLFDPKAFFTQQWKMDNIIDSIGQYFRTQEKQDFSIQFSRYRRNAISLIHDEGEKAKPGDIVRIYAVGGEEILFDCLNGIAHFPNMQLASIPYGESNDFLLLFGEDNIEKFRDIPSLVQADALSTDVIRWGVNYALNSCYIGASSVLSKQLKDLKSSLNKVSFIAVSKFFVFINRILSAFNRETAARAYRITIDDEDYSGRYSLIHVANGPYIAGKLTGAADAAPDDGFLDIVLIKSSYPLRTLFSLSRYSKGKRPKNSVFVQGKRVSVESDSEMWIQMDNEYIKDTKINLNIVHHSINMVALNGLSYPIASITTL